jgi:hypothetical protein
LDRSEEPTKLLKPLLFIHATSRPSRRYAQLPDGDTGILAKLHSRNIELPQESTLLIPPKIKGIPQYEIAGAIEAMKPRPLDRN